MEFSNVQHIMSVTLGKQDGVQRKLYDREIEVRQLRAEIAELSTKASD